MKKTTLKGILTLIACALLIAQKPQAQELIYEVPLTTQVQSSTQIIEGKVISKESFWDADQNNIYTANTVEVYKVFKGNPTLTTVEVITPGGTVGLHAEIVTPSLSLSKGDIGIFMLQDNTIHLTSQASQLYKFQAFASSQGFYKYNQKANIAANPITSVYGIENSFHNSIKQITNSVPVVIKKEFNTTLPQETNLNRGAISITNFTPITVTGGTDTTITINGTGFGNTQGTVGFRDANFGGETESPANSGTFVPVYYTALDSEIISWSDTQIVVEVPSRAGTGDIEVTPDAGGSATSSQSLTVSYSELNVIFDPGSGEESYITRHIDRNGNGGYVWQMFTDFDANTAAKDAFLRAFDSWRCETNVFWEIGNVTTTDVIANDNINIVRFDNGAELPTGVLGRCTSRYSGCGGATINWYVEELDIVFEDNFTGDLSVLSWEFGPDTATGFEVDFESVAVHELGHGHQLAHVINPGQVMHYSIANSQNSRALNDDDTAAGNDVYSRSSSSSVCGQTVMGDYDCDTLGTNDDELISSISIFPNPAKDILNIKHASNIDITNAVLYDVRGRLISKVNLSVSSNVNSIDIRHLNSGLYFIRIDANDKTLTKKFIVE
ncbi:T9SS type A sorting domain-containing protein [uncultured Psychroserpens sp.]|uniref:T9SS type A sorting domain-containing protein n=1 Tax=uncultured Psychroserpens sp. TaxID=255436 RepID=UPI002607C69F|nr:T9SS type A sorting domain-containing protein [uncultured Psychroserpens sp.]